MNFLQWYCFMYFASIAISLLPPAKLSMMQGASFGTSKSEEFQFCGKPNQIKLMSLH